MKTITNITYFAFALFAFAFLTGSAAAQTTPVRSFPIREGSQPFAITVGEDGNFWFTLSNSSKVARITPCGSIKYSRTPSLSNPAFITPGPDGNIWFGEGSTGKIASITPDGVITEYLFSASAWASPPGPMAISGLPTRPIMPSGVMSCRAGGSRDSEHPPPTPFPATLLLAPMGTCGSPNRQWTNLPASPRKESSPSSPG